MTIKIFKIAQIQTKPEERRNRTRSYNPMQLKALQEWTNEVKLARPFGHVS